jgi:asparagine synthase (glutamine-hydrolysing)
MCGLAAIYAYHPDAPPVGRAELLRIRERMRARGPDGAGEWLAPDRRVGLGHRRLSVVELGQAGAQPMATPEGDLRVVFNGEIYNYRELRGELEALGHRFASRSDTEALLHGYREWGRDMPRHLRGMYAFALWDANRRGLFMARDPLGIKPLYYADDGHSLRAASQVKALLAGGAVATAPEPAGHAGFFLWGHVPEPFTLYRDIRALPAGTSLWAGPSGASDKTAFFSLARLFRQAEARPQAPDPARRRAVLREALLDSVRRHLIADVPVGVFLSAGLDSATLAALAGEVAEGGLRTLTLGFDEFAGTADDEAPLAARMAAHINSRHTSRKISGRDFKADRARIHAAMDQPTVDGVNAWYICKAAREAGLKAALSGIGGDELFGGYAPSFRQIPRAVSILGPAGRIPAAGRLFRQWARPLLGRWASPKYAGLLEYSASYGKAYLLRRSLFMPWELPGILGPRMAGEGLARLSTVARLEEDVAGIGSPHLKVAALEMGWYMRNQLLRDADWASMDHGLELRTPLVDAELLASLLPWFTGGNHLDKQAMAGAPALPLPQEILKRPKSGFGIPVRAWHGGADSPPGGRGLRGWAQAIYRQFVQ